MAKTLKVGTRASALALRQVKEIEDSLKKIYPDIRLDIITIDTYGDKDKVTPISDIEGSDFFTKEIDEALLDGKIDFAVHSAKDLPDNLNGGLKIACITSSVDPYDCLVSKSGLKLKELPYGARIGTSSLRRKTQLKRFRDDFQIVDIRGSIEERLHLLEDRQDLDAIVIAAIGLVRLGLENRITERLPFGILKPHPLQGSLAIVGRKEDVDLPALFKDLR